MTSANLTLFMPHTKIICLFVLLFLLNTNKSMAQEQGIDSLLNVDLDEVVVFSAYHFKNDKDEKRYKQLEADLRIVYPLVMIVKKEYIRINKEMEFYTGDREKKYLKWCERYIRDNYMPMLSGLNARQGRLFLKLIDRQLEVTPYYLIKSYRNKFRAIMWQGAAHLFFANLKSEYHETDHPMIEHILKMLDTEYMEDSSGIDAVKVVP